MTNLTRNLVAFVAAHRRHGRQQNVVPGRFEVLTNENSVGPVTRATVAERHDAGRWRREVAVQGDGQFGCRTCSGGDGPSSGRPPVRVAKIFSAAYISRTEAQSRTFFASGVDASRGC